MDRSSRQTNGLVVTAETNATEVDAMETEMVDLSGVAIEELRTSLAEPLEPYVDRVMTSIGRPRTNLGGTGPPGRDD